MTTTVKLQPLCVSPPLAYTTLLPRSSPSTPSLSIVKRKRLLLVKTKFDEKYVKPTTQPSVYE